MTTLLAEAPENSDMPVAVGCGDTQAAGSLPGGAPVDQLITLFIPVARQIARRIHDAMPPNHIHEFDDLLQAGTVGLLSAARSYRPETGVVFPVYARFRIRGEILDHLRRSDLAPRALRRKQRHFSEATHRLRSSLGREPGLNETADAMGLTLGEGHELARNLHNVFRLTGGIADISSEETLASVAACRDQARPDKALEHEEIRQILRNAVEALPYKQREILASYYFRGQSMREIGQRLGVHTTRVFQLRQRALESLCSRLRGAGIHSAVDLGQGCSAED